MIKFIILMLFSSCATFIKKDVDHWNIQLSKYDKKFQSRMSMSQNALWVIDYQYPNNINKYKKNSNQIFAYLMYDTKDFDKNIKVIQSKEFDGVVLEFSKDLDNLEILNAIKLIKNNNLKIYFYNHHFALNDKNISDNLDGVILSGLFFNAQLIQQNKISQLEDLIISLKRKNLKVLSVEYTVSLSLMNKYKKFIQRMDILGLVTDTKKSGATFLHFVGNN